MPEIVPVGENTAYPTGRCYCGCGERLKNPTKFFVVGHDKIAISKVINERYGNTPNFLLAHGAGPEST